jgi:hypothetical protein
MAHYRAHMPAAIVREPPAGAPTAKEPLYIAHIAFRVIFPDSHPAGTAA